jgi:predicted ATPase
MRIERLALKNFKCFKEVDVSFSRITLLTGENSSGKSSLIYGILAPIQSINSHSNSFPLYLSLNGNYVNMGGGEDISFNHNTNNKLGIYLNILTDFETFIFDTNWGFETKNRYPVINHLKMSSRLEQIELTKDVSNDYIATLNIRNGGITNSANLRTNNIDDITKEFHGGHPIVDSFFDSLHNSLDEEFNFISSFRLHPDRTYYLSKSNNKVDKFGSGYIDQILDWHDRQSDKLNDLVSLLKSVNILHDIRTHKLLGGRFEIKVKVKSKSKWESLADVGFGISQFLPIIVADLQLWDNSTLIMSQPEIHLHPSVQANLGDYLVKQVKEKNKNYIVETHSEYLLNRMRLLIVKGEIQPEDVAIYYFENSIKDGSITHRIEFTKDGQILNAPKGFFETYMIDTMDIALNA